MAPQVGRAHALGVEAHARPLTQPVREPGQVAVAVQVVGMQATKWKASSSKQKNPEIVISKPEKFFSNNKKLYFLT